MELQRHNESIPKVCKMRNMLLHLAKAFLVSTPLVLSTQPDEHPHVIKMD